MQDYLISNQTYRNLKKTVTIVLPGLATLYAVLSGVLGLPSPVLVLATLASLTVVGGLLMHVSEKSWLEREDIYDGVLATVGHDADTGIPNLQLNILVDPTTLVGRQYLLLKSIDARDETN